MLREHHQLFRALNLAAELTAIVVCHAVIRSLQHGAGTTAVFDPALLILLFFLGIVLAFSPRSYTYRFRDPRSAAAEVLRQWSLAVSLTGAALLLHNPWMLPPETLLAMFIAGAVCLIALRIVVAFALRGYRRSGRSYRKALIVGTGDSARSLTDDILGRPEHGIHLVGYLHAHAHADLRLWSYRDIPLRGGLHELPRLIREEQLDYVIFAVTPAELPRLLGTIAICTRMGVPTVIAQEWVSRLGVHRRAEEFCGHPSLVLESTPQEPAALVVKSLIDRIAAALGLVALAPAFLVVALLVRSTSPGPVFFRQTRVGRNGRRFRLYKFRTMVENAEDLKAQLADRNEMSGPVFKITDDPRVTPLGRILRRTSIDELPQLINVAKGEMSLVGPRPPLPEEVAEYESTHRRRLSMKPGLTCLWQVGGRNTVDFDEWMKLDLDYIDNWSLARDAGILLKTIPTVVRGTGAK